MAPRPMTTAIHNHAHLSIPGLVSRAARSSALAHRERHHDAEMQEAFTSSIDDSPELPEARSLRQFHRAMRGKGWRRKNGWSASDMDAPRFRLSDFDGVTVGVGGHVNQIRLRSNNLSVTIFSPGQTKGGAV